MKKSVLFKVAMLIATILVGVVYWLLFSGNTTHQGKTRYVYIPSGCTDEGFRKIILDSNVLQQPNTFWFLANKMGLWGNIKSGRYGIQAGMGNFSLVRMFRSGQQVPVRVVINKLRTAGNFFQKLDAGLEADSTAFAHAFLDSTFLQSMALTPAQMPVIIVPATYEIWWNASPKEVVEKFKKAYQTFWNNERKALAEAMQLTIPDVVTVASIVEEETNQNDEKALVASVYLNRLRKGMKLDADPTVKFAVGDFSLRRILHVHTAFESPYNTYRVIGLPPGPICTPSSASIDAVLKNEKSDYLFFCAKEDFSGHHNFASTYETHLKNARMYQEALNARGIR